MRLPMDSILCALLGFVVLVGCSDSPPPVSYAPYEDDYRSKMDFARIEHELPLRPKDLVKLTHENLMAASQEQVDQIYARLTAGPIPDGVYQGELFFPKGSSGRARIAEIAGDGIKGVALRVGAAQLELVANVMWKGKVFYRNQRILRSRINNLLILKPFLGGDIVDIPKMTVDGQDAWLLFPAKVYCGQSLLDGRRESVVIDYAFNDDIEGYRENPDFLAGRRGFQIRDEIRMVRPGFYLGRAYMGRIFIVNFTLENKALAAQHTDSFLKSGEIAEDCWVGSQRIAASAE